MIPVPDIRKIDTIFGNIAHLPSKESIPEKFDMMSRTFQNDFVERWFFQGVSNEEVEKLIPKKGVDKNKALVAIVSILRSMAPKHEHKIAGAAYLLSEWFEEPINR
jgi:hypothetical protein